MTSGISDLFIIIVILALTITFHEFMHGYVAYRLGDDTAKHSGRLTLNPLAHIDPFLTVILPLLLFLSGAPVFGAAKPVPFNPSRLRNGETGMAMVALAGPLTNLALASFIALWLNLVSLPIQIQNAFILFVIVNLGFFVFNMIPFPPLDGSRLLYALAPEPIRDLMRRVESFGLIGVAIFIFLLFPVMAPLIGRAIIYLAELLLSGVSLSF